MGLRVAYGLTITEITERSTHSEPEDELPKDEEQEDDDELSPLAP